MLICCELKNLRQKLLEESSFSIKEKAFYWFLSGKPLNYPPDNNLLDIQQICLSVFCNDAPSMKELIKRKQSENNISGMHYTQNIIDLSAMAKVDLMHEREKLISYCRNHSTRDFFILNHLFPNISRDPPIPQGDIDKIALHLYEGDFPPEDWKSLLFWGFQETTDLHDLYVVEQAYLKAMDDHPIVHQVSNIEQVRNACANFVEKTERNVKRTIKTISFLLVIPIFGLLAPFIYRNWEEIEPIWAIIELLGVLFGIIMVIFLGIIPDKVRFVNSRIEKLIDWVFRLKGFNRTELKESLVKLSNDCEF